MPSEIQRFMHQIPPYIWGLLFVLLTLVLYMLFKMWSQSRSLRAAFNAMSDLVGEGEEQHGLGRGISLSHLEEIRIRAEQMPLHLRQWWHRIEHHLEAYQGSGQSREYFLARPARDVLPEGELFEAMYHGSQYQALPGIVTSIGLAGTFAAILIGLFFVTYNPSDPTQPVRGIDKLINNLSGKFASSLVALLLSIFFVFFEKRAEKRIRVAYDRLITRIEDALPLLTPVRVLVDLQASAAKQEVALREISSDMVDRFKAAFTTEINPALSHQFSQNLMTELQPTLVRMTESLGSLTGVIRTLETSKNDTLLRDLTAMVKAMHGSLLEGLQGMGTEFHQALAGSARLDLEQMHESLAASRMVLDQLNSRLNDMGSKMVESLGVFQLGAQQQTEDAISRIGVMANKAQEESSRAVEESIASLQAVLTQASSEVSVLIGTVGEGARDFARASQRLVEIQHHLQENLAEQGSAIEEATGVWEGLRAASRSFNDAITGANTLVVNQGATVRQMVDLSKDLTLLQKGSASVVQEYRVALQSTQAGLGSLDQDLVRAFDGIHAGMRVWTEGVESSLQSLTTHTNQHMATISMAFSRQIEELTDKLSEFNEALDRVIKEREP